MFEIKTEEETGRGLYATKTILPGEVVTVCELLILNPVDTVIINQTDLRYYVFKFSENQDCLVLGDGELFNHSESANVAFSIEKQNNRFVMVFRATATIHSSSQLFINYASDEKVEILKYITRKSLTA